MLVGVLGEVLGQDANRLRKIDSIRFAVFKMPDDTTKALGLITLSRRMAIYITDSAILHSKQGLELSQRLQYVRGIANANMLLGQILYQVKNKHTIGMAYYQKALDTGYPPLQSKLYSFMAAHYNRMGNLDTALILLKRATDISIELRDSSSLANNYALRAGLYASVESTDSAMYYQQLVIEMFTALKKDPNLATAYLNLSGSQIRAGDYNHALLSLQKSLDKYSLTNFEPGKSHVYASYGYIHELQKDYEKALQYYRMSAEIRFRYKDLDRLSSSYNTIASIHKMQPNYDSAMFYYKKSLAIEKIKPSKQRKIKTLIGYADLLIKLESFDSAQYYYQSIYDEGRALKDKSVILEGGLGLSKVNVVNGNYQSAVKRVESLIAMAIELGNKQLEKECYELLYTSYEKLNNYQKAFSYVLNYQSITDSLFNDEQSKEFGRLEAKYEFEKEKDILETENRIREFDLEQEVLREKYLGMTGSAFLLTLLAVGVHYYRIKTKANKVLKTKNALIQEQSEELRLSGENEKRLLSEKVQAQERELATLAMQSNEKNNVLNHLSDKLNTMTFDKSNAAEIKELNSTITKNIKNDNTWDTFLHKFEAIYPYFFQKLKAQFEALTLNELKLCGYIKIGMSNNEIMNVANVANSTVKKNLNRLKKKLDLGPEDSIRDFLIKYA
jgi:hypothetical protein